MLTDNKYSFPSSARLRKSKEFVRIGKMGCRVHTPHFILLKMPSASHNSRLGLTVSRKVGNAVRRNRIKRLLREFFRLNQHLFEQPTDLSIIAKRNSAGITAKMIEQELSFLKKKG